MNALFVTNIKTNRDTMPQFATRMANASVDTTLLVMGYMAWHPKQLFLLSGKSSTSILPGTQMKPADLFIPTWSAGKPLAIDISVVSPTQSHLLLYNHTQTEKLCAAHWREEQNTWRPFTFRTFCSYPWQLKHLVDGGWRADQFLPLLRTEFQGALARQNHVSSTNYTSRGNMPVQ